MFLFSNESGIDSRRLIPNYVLNHINSDFSYDHSVSLSVQGEMKWREKLILIKKNPFSKYCRKLQERIGGGFLELISGSRVS